MERDRNTGRRVLHVGRKAGKIPPVRQQIGQNDKIAAYRTLDWTPESHQNSIRLFVPVVIDGTAACELFCATPFPLLACKALFIRALQWQDLEFSDWELAEWKTRTCAWAAESFRALCRAWLRPLARFCFRMRSRRFLRNSMDKTVEAE